MEIIKKIILPKKNKFNSEEINNVLNVLNSEKRTQYVNKLERLFAKTFKVKYAIAHNSGTGTLHSCLKALNIGYGDEVITPSHTVIMCTFAILACNAVPVYADINPETFNIDPRDIEMKITKKTKAIIAVHMHGLPADMKSIIKISKKYKIPVIEDSAQCMLGKIKGKLAGTFGDLASFSFETKKHLCGFEGGMVITNNKKLAMAVRKFGGLGYKNLRPNSAMGASLPRSFQNPHYKRHDSLGLNYRMNEITAAVVYGQLKKIKKLVYMRQKISKIILSSIKNCSWLIPQKTPQGYVNSYWTIAIKFLGEKKIGLKWQDFYDLHKKNKGDGFYAGLSVVPDEIILQSQKKIKKYLPNYIKCGACKTTGKTKCINTKYKYSCKNAYSVQPLLIQYKSNYRDLQEAKKQSVILKKTIEQFEKLKKF